jgi:hypothetical protein
VLRLEVEDAPMELDLELVREMVSAIGVTCGGPPSWTSDVLTERIDACLGQLRELAKGIISLCIHYVRAGDGRRP